MVFVGVIYQAPGLLKTLELESNEKPPKFDDGKGRKKGRNLFLLKKYIIFLSL
jgi:hypothetical protein